jgi:ABC-type ATPase with predicted acetyltransferase domain
MPTFSNRKFEGYHFEYDAKEASYKDDFNNIPKLNQKQIFI